MITYLTGDATRPAVAGSRLIVHVCNDYGRWGRGFVLAVSKRWPEPEASYRRWHRESNNSADWPAFRLGSTVFVPVSQDAEGHRTFVSNMVAQHGTETVNDIPPIRYGALETCLNDVRFMALDQGASVHMPRIGCGLAGGTWDKVGPIVERTLHDVEVYVYDLPTSA